jgi:hypothetical protein
MLVSSVFVCITPCVFYVRCAGSVIQKSAVLPPSEEHERREYIDLLDRCIKQVDEIEKKIKNFYMVTQCPSARDALVKILEKVCFIIFFCLRHLVLTLLFSTKLDMACTSSKKPTAERSSE